VSLDLYPNCFKALVYEISNETVERLLRYGSKTSDLLFVEFWVRRILDEDTSDYYETWYDDSSPLFWYTFGTTPRNGLDLTSLRAIRVLQFDNKFLICSDTTTTDTDTKLGIGGRLITPKPHSKYQAVISTLSSTNPLAVLKLSDSRQPKHDDQRRWALAATQKPSSNPPSILYSKSRLDPMRTNSENW